MLITNLKVNVDYFKTSYIPPKISQVCCNRISSFNNLITAEIMNDNPDVALYKSPVVVKAYDNKDLFMGENGWLVEGETKILYLPPKGKYLFMTFLDWDTLRYQPSIHLLFSNTIISKVNFGFYPLKWKDFSNISLPQVKISNDNIIEINGKHFLQYDITNHSDKWHSFQVKAGFYNSNGNLIGGAFEITTGSVRPYVPETRKIKVPFELPSDYHYKIQLFPNTFFFNPFKKKK
jgi:hypothetical protein